MYTFDADGFLATRGGDTFAYDRSGDLRSATVGGTEVTYAYDAIGRRVAASRAISSRSTCTATSTRRGGSPPRGLRTERSTVTSTGRGQPPRHPAREPEALRGHGPGRLAARGRERSGAVVKRLEYDAYGVETDLDTGFFLPIGYAGGLRDPVTRLVRFGLRDYEPESGRFTARDPAGFDGSSRNLFAYASNSPVSFRDLDGRRRSGSRRMPEWAAA